MQGHWGNAEQAHQCRAALTGSLAASLLTLAEVLPVGPANRGGASAVNAYSRVEKIFAVK